MRMKIRLVPARMDDRIEVAVRGETLIVNGIEVDLSAATAAAPLLPEAGQPWILDAVIRHETGADRGLELSLLLPHGANAPAETRFPADLVVTEDGPVALPPYDAPPPALDAGMIVDLGEGAVSTEPA
jgi:hypothetical protein